MAATKYKKRNKDIVNGVLGNNLWEYAATSKKRIDIRVQYGSGAGSKFVPRTGEVIWDPTQGYQQQLPSGENPQRTPSMKLFEEVAVAVDVLVLGTHIYGNDNKDSGYELDVDQPVWNCSAPSGTRHSGKVNFGKYYNYRQMKTRQLNKNAAMHNEGVFDESIPERPCQVNQGPTSTQ